MKTKRTKRKNKYRELRAAIAAIRRNNGALLAVLPQWPEEGGMVKAAVAAFFRERGKAAAGDVAAFLEDSPGNGKRKATDAGFGMLATAPARVGERGEKGIGYSSYKALANASLM